MNYLTYVRYYRDKNRSGVAGLRDDYVPGDLGFDPLQVNRSREQ